MPTYEYKCPLCGVFEHFESITAPALEECPTCGGRVCRIISRNVTVLYKGSGFYTTDYAKGDRKAGDSPATKEASAAG